MRRGAGGCRVYDTQRSTGNLACSARANMNHVCCTCAIIQPLFSPCLGEQPRVSPLSVKDNEIESRFNKEVAVRRGVGGAPRERNLRWLMSAAINHVRLLAPEDFFAPIVLVMKAALDAMRSSGNFGKEQSETRVILARTYARITSTVAGTMGDVERTTVVGFYSGATNGSLNKCKKKYDHQKTNWVIKINKKSWQKCMQFS